MERFEFETTQGQVLEASDEATLMNFARIRANAMRPCALVALLTVGFGGWFFLNGNWKTGLYTLLLGLILAGFFWIPTIRARRFQPGLRVARAQRENLTDAVRSKTMRFVLEGDSCRLLDGKGEEIRAWEPVWMAEARESDRIFWLPLGETAVLLPKNCMKVGTEDAFRVWLRGHSKNYRRCNVTDRLRRKAEQ